MNNSGNSLTEQPKARVVPGISESVNQALPTELDTPDFREAWADYREHRRQQGGKKFTKVAEKRAIVKMQAMGAARAIAALTHSMANGWTGIHEENSNGRSRQGSTGADRETPAMRDAARNFKPHLNGIEGVRVVRNPRS